MAIFKINQINTNVIEFNKTASETIVMIHGMFTSMTVFYFKIAPYLAEKYHVVLYDLKGHGMSDAAKSGYDLQSLSSDLLEIMNLLEIEKAHLVGYSYGGMVALYTALHHPEKVNKVAIIDTPNPNKNTPDLLEVYSKDYLKQTIDRTISVQFSVTQRQINKLYNLHQYLFNNTTIIEDTVRNKSFFRDIIGKNISHETLLLYADESDCRDDGKLLLGILKNARLLYGRGDHNIPVQNPEWINEKLYEFLND